MCYMISQTYFHYITKYYYEEQQSPFYITENF